jgi:segregation and condensation protein B
MRLWAREKIPATTTTTSMSKRKGRRLTSEIKSVMRAPPEAEGELEPARESLDARDDALPSGSGEASAETAGDSETRGANARAGAPSDGPRGAEPASEVTAPASAAELVEHETAPDEPADALGRADAFVEEPESPAASELHAAVPEDEPDLVGDDSDEAEGGAARFAEPISFDDAGDDTEGFLRGLVEALLFTSQKPIDVKDLARSAGIDKPRARELIEQLRASYDGRGLCIEEVAGGFVMRSSPRYAPYIHKILALKPVRLSRAQLETLAIVAYRQPVTKPEVDDIRGVDSGQVIKGLLERSLLKMLGKKDEPGHPTLYGTTNEFLELLNLQSLKDLPTLREYTELSEESQRKFQEATGDAAPSEAITFERPPAAPSTSPEDDEAEDGPGQPRAPEISTDAGLAGEGELDGTELSAESLDAAADDVYRKAAGRTHSDVVAVDAAELGEPEGVGGDAGERAEEVDRELAEVDLQERDETEE